MPTLTMQTLGRRLAEKRGARGVREAAKEIGISHATLSRVERGYLPDLDTFSKLCKWLEVNPGEVLGVKSETKAIPRASAHFRTDQALKPETARALADLILAANRALMANEK